MARSPMRIPSPQDGVGLRGLVSLARNTQRCYTLSKSFSCCSATSVVCWVRRILLPTASAPSSSTASARASSTASAPSCPPTAQHVRGHHSTVKPGRKKSRTSSGANCGAGPAVAALLCCAAWGARAAVPAGGGHTGAGLAAGVVLPARSPGLGLHAGILAPPGVPDRRGVIARHGVPSAHHGVPAHQGAPLALAHAHRRVPALAPGATGARLTVHALALALVHAGTAALGTAVRGRVHLARTTRSARTATHPPNASNGGWRQALAPSRPNATRRSAAF